MRNKLLKELIFEFGNK